MIPFLLTVILIAAIIIYRLVRRIEEMRERARQVSLELYAYIKTDELPEDVQKVVIKSVLVLEDICLPSQI